MVRLFVLLLLLAGCICARAEQYPSRPITIVVGFAAGASTDIVTRIVAGRLAQKLAVPVIVENKPGADGILAAADVVHANSEYRLLTLIDAMLYRHRTPPLSYGEGDFTYIASFGAYPPPWFITAAGGAQTLAEVLRRTEVKIAHGSFVGRICALRLQKETGAPLLHVPYGRGETEAFPDLIAGRTDLMCSIPTASLAIVQGGQVQVLATTGKERDTLASDVPAMPELGLPDFGLAPYTGLAGPKSMSAASAEVLAKAVQEVLREPDTARALSAVHFSPIPEGVEVYQRSTKKRVELLNSMK